MKNTWIVGLFLLAAVSASAETVSSVSFNPSRLGNFEKLKVSGAATLRGGLTTPELNIGGRPTVVDRSESGDVAVSPGATVTMTATQPYSMASVVSTGTATISYNALNMPSATFRGLNTSGHDYTIATNSFRTGSLIPVDVNGGTLDFSADSFINRLVANNNLVAYAKKITVDGTLKVTGETSTLWERKTNGKFSVEGLSGFKLGNITIPYPSEEGGVQFRPSAENEYVSNPSLNMDTCKLAWIKRKVNTSDPSAEYVLGFTDNGSTHCVPTCADSAPQRGVHSQACGGDLVGNKHHQVIRQTVCQNGEPELVTCFLSADEKSCTDTPSNWDESECQSKLMWRRIDSWNNNYRYPRPPQAATTDNGYDWCAGFWVGNTCIGVSGHWIGIDETKCYYDSSHRLRIGDSVSTSALFGLGQLCAAYDDWWVCDELNVTFKRLIVNRVNRVVHNNDIVVNAPACDEAHSDREGQTVEESVYALDSWYGNILPVLGDMWTRCVGVNETIKYKCSRS